MRPEALAGGSGGTERPTREGHNKGMLIHLTSASLEEDPRLADYTSMTDVHLRKSLEVERGLYMAESTNVIIRALEAGHHPRSLIMAPRWLPDLEPLLERFLGAKDGGEVPVFIAPEPILESITGFHLHRGALASMQRPVLPSVADLLSSLGDGPKRILILENLVDHTNVGAAFRSAAALGADAVLVTPECADPLYRRSVRVSMGTVFQVPWTRLEDWPANDDLHAAGYSLAALALSDDSVSLDEFVTMPVMTAEDSRVALVMGTEGDGLRKSTLSRTDYVVRIPMMGGVDSLNVAAASAVALWATRLPRA